ncbi:hypothetical protein J1N35_046154 [Gossypium stocksii]|uniref:DUF4283 domain-containing protein n=1 Tax=Gossypium stocksii TaxID=47602 RepID=A0A9D3U5E0_9ROSI|nr:hypothetical protein J1N35_046154 [Gossypium stocksii]
MEDDISTLLAKLSFSKEETKRVISTKANMDNTKGYEHWAIGKLMTKEKVNREAMHRVFKSLWYTKEEVNFVSIKEGVILVKFYNKEDRKRILNLSPWLFDQCLFNMVPYSKDKSMEEYDFNHSPFWVRISNIPIEYMDRKMALEVGNAIGEVLAIDWRDREGGWTEYIRIRISIDINKPLHRVFHYIDHEGKELVCVIRYEKLPRFCYICGMIVHTTQKCEKQMINNESQDNIFEYGNWLRVSIKVTNQNNGLLRNGIEIIKEDIVINRKSYRKIRKVIGTNEVNDPEELEQVQDTDDDSELSTPQEKRLMKGGRDSIGKIKSKRKRQRGHNEKFFEWMYA